MRLSVFFPRPWLSLSCQIRTGLPERMDCWKYIEPILVCGLTYVAQWNQIAMRYNLKAFAVILLCCAERQWLLPGLFTRCCDGSRILQSNRPGEFCLKYTINLSYISLALALTSVLLERIPMRLTWWIKNLSFHGDPETAPKLLQIVECVASHGLHDWLHKVSMYQECL